MTGSVDPTAAGSDVAPDRTGAATDRPSIRPVRIGLTGPIGCGKSTVAAHLARRGAIIIDADQVARGVTEPGEPALAAIVARFGVDVLGPDGSMLARSKPSTANAWIGVELDPEPLERARENPWFALKKRRPEAYDELTTRI